MLVQNWNKILQRFVVLSLNIDQILLELEIFAFGREASLQINLSVRPLRVSWLRGYWPFPDHFLGWNDECVHAVDCYDSNSNHTLQHSFQEITYNCIHYINMYITVKFICIIVRFPRRLAPYIIQPFYHLTKIAEGFDFLHIPLELSPVGFHIHMYFHESGTWIRTKRSDYRVFI